MGRIYHGTNLYYGFLRAVKERHDMKRNVYYFTGKAKFREGQRGIFNAETLALRSGIDGTKLPKFNFFLVRNFTDIHS